MKSTFKYSACILFLALLLNSCSNNDSNPTIEESIYLTSQEEVDAFGMNGYQIIKGNLAIESISTDDPITDLSPLADLISVDLDITIKSSSITSLTGLNKLEEILGDFRIEDNNLLSNLEGLGSLRSIGGDFRIFNNQSLIATNGINELSVVEGILDISFNPLLSNLTGFESVNSLSELRVYSNIGLMSLDGFERLNELGFGVFINQNPALESISGLSGINSLKRLVIQANEKLSSLDGLQGITELESLDIALIPITDLSGLENLRSVSTELVIGLASNLRNLDGLNNVNTVEDLVISSNENLENIDALQSLNSSSRVVFINNPLLSDFCVISDLINNQDFVGEFLTRENAFNPNKEDLGSGNCRD
ncbi:hypothetical protein [Roseivirga sp.]|uniref:hypothetical protein n=1 Tax=Roseivirga sp. TaxID=1964215 RepID=UPI003B8C5280